jgi:hypothetical protein
LYSRQPPDHFKLYIEPVDLGIDVPLGIGVSEVIPDPTVRTGASAVGLTTIMTPTGPVNGMEILVDPMTREVISAETENDQNGKPRLDPLVRPIKTRHDYWFALDFKLKWTGAPQSTAPGPGGRPPPSDVEEVWTGKVMTSSFM